METLCTSCNLDPATHGDLCEDCHDCARQEELEGALLRFQDAGYALSRSHRSETWGNDDGGADDVHAGSSVVRGWANLGRATACLYGGDVELIVLEGDEVGTGWDGEPVVIPTRELRRFRFARERDAKFPLAGSPEELLAAGWVEVETMGVVD